MQLWLYFLLAACALVVCQIDRVTIAGIEPDAGPLSGGTRVLVRGGPFRGKETEFKKPRCRFGSSSRIVNATYVKCTPQPMPPGGREPEAEEKTEVCLQCDDNKAGELPEIVPFTISLVGDFSDSANSVHYRYYPDPVVKAIYPRYGRKNGGTFVQIWGENFLNFDQYLRCSFGTKETPAYFVNEHYLYCYSPTSDVIDAAMPLAITMNDQQYSNAIDYWFYEFPSVFILEPSRGPDTGGTHVLVKGNNFDPFAEYPINNLNDTFCRFGALGIVPVTVINSTKVVCISPPSYVLREVPVEITLNNQEWTRDGILFHYYHPPFVYNIDPLMGPVSGGTEVHVHGSNFEDTGTIRCKFGEQVVNGTFINVNELLCVSPRTDKPGYVPFQAAVHEDDFSSGEYVQYLYYDTPIIQKIEPTCGPERGYTQITITGKNFIDSGFDMVYCVFNRTVWMNATVYEPNKIKCSSPPVLNRFGVNEKNVKFYDIEITLNKKDMNGPMKRFHYYKEVTIKSVTPPGGPIEGGTPVRVEGKSFNPSCACNITARFGTFQMRTTGVTDTVFGVIAPNVSQPDDVVVSYGINGQQYNPDLKINTKDVENTYTYYAQPIVTFYSPKRGPTTGNTLIKFQGFGFTPFRDSEGKVLKYPAWVRMREYNKTNKVTNATEAEIIDNNRFTWRTPPGEADSKHIIELSLNGFDYTPILPINENYSYTYFNAPHVVSLDPPFGPAKSIKEVILSVRGINFLCGNSSCEKVYCRFGKGEEAIIVPGKWISEHEIKCAVPKYNRPDVVPVEISLDGDYYTSDNKEYGFYDPFVYSITPKMVSKKGNTTITIKGFGFVNTTGTYLKTRYGYITKKLICKGGQCAVMSKYINKNTIQAITFPYSSVVYEESSREIKDDDFPAEVAVYGDDYTENNVTIFYFAEPDYGDPQPPKAPANGGEIILIPADFKTNDTEKGPKENEESKIKPYINVTCRYTSLNKKVVVTRGSAEHWRSLEDASAVNKSMNLNAIFCKSPEWVLPDNVEEESVILDISINGGADYSGAKVFKITERLEIYRLYPTCGPTYGRTPMHIYGTGFKQSDNFYLKWGVVSTILSDQSSIDYFVFQNNKPISSNPFENEIVSLNEDARLLFKNMSRYQSAISYSPKLPNWDRTHGGQVYLSLGKTTELRVFKSPEFLFYNYGPSFMEYYYYKQPVVKDMRPHAGTTLGGTSVIIRGAWFKYKPEYGVIPHARFGDKITRCEFESTVRIICRTPANTYTDTPLEVEVSLNGVDFTPSGFMFHYYLPPIIKDFQPKSGPESGGTRVRMLGNGFTNLSSGTEFMCRFTSLDKKMPPKFIPAIFENSSSVICPTPGGWGSGSKVNIEITFNGYEYTNSSSTFFFYSLYDATPRSGPSDGTAGYIYINGSGFRDSNLVYCAFDDTKYKPIEVTWDMIICKIPRAKMGDDFFGSVPLEVSINGFDYHKFEGGFHFYPQIQVSDFYPKIGPAKGKGVVKFYGNGFRSDFALARPACKFGKYIGRGEVLSENEMLCHIPEIDVINQSYTAEAALNSQSFVPASCGEVFTPYGIYDIVPNSGPISTQTQVLVKGEGFPSEGKSKCRIGVFGSYAIVEGRVLNSQSMICVMPKSFEIPKSASLPATVPFSISFFDEKISNPWAETESKKGKSSSTLTSGIRFDSWTETGHVYRYYLTPVLGSIKPKSAKVGEVIDVYAYATAKAPFIEPLAALTGKEEVTTKMTCSFGRFGITPAFYVNSSTVRCVTPNVQDDPETIREETVYLKVAPNGVDYTADTDNALFTFMGTATVFKYWPYIIALILAFIALLAMMLCCYALYIKLSAIDPMAGRGTAPLIRPHVVRDELGLFRSRGFFDQKASPAAGQRSTVAMPSQGEPRKTSYMIGQ